MRITEAVKKLDPHGSRRELTIKLEDMYRTVSVSFKEGEPRENTLSGNFRDCFEILNLIGRAHAAGKMGQKIELVRK